MVAWFVVCLMALIALLLTSGLYRSRARRRRLIAEFRQMRAARKARWSGAGT